MTCTFIHSLRAPPIFFVCVTAFFGGLWRYTIIIMLSVFLILLLWPYCVVVLCVCLSVCYSLFLSRILSLSLFAPYELEVNFVKIWVTYTRSL